MIKELTPYQSGHTDRLNQTQAAIESRTRIFLENQYHQNYSLTLTKKEMEWVSPTLKRYLEGEQGTDAKEYILNGDKNVIQFLLYSPKEEIRKKYFIALSEGNQENIPLMLQILYYRLQKAKLLGFKNSYELLKEEKVSFIVIT